MRGAVHTGQTHQPSQASTVDSQAGRQAAHELQGESTDNEAGCQSVEDRHERRINQAFVCTYVRSFGRPFVRKTQMPIHMS